MTESESNRNQQQPPERAEEIPAGDMNDVTRAQEGQFIQESSGLERVVVPPRRQGGTLENADLDSVRAKNVSMDRSGAEQIDAETVNMQNAGAKSIRATSVEMRNSGSMTVTGDTVTMNQSSSMLVAGQKVEAQQSGIFSIQAESATLDGDSRQAVLVAGKVNASGDVRAVLGVIGKVEGNGQVQVLVDPASAAAMGAGFAVVLTLLRRLLWRKRG